jgi:NADH-quinone oxidoreductase chain I
MRSTELAPGDGGRGGLIGGVFRPLWVTIKQTVRAARKPVTRLYPYERIELPASYRGQHVIDWYKCIGCELCAKVCPNECIYFEFIEVDEDSPYLLPPRASMDKMKHVIRRPAVDVGHCLFCGNCSEYCPTDAWMFSQEFELADYTREDLFYHAEELKTPDEESDRKQVLINRMGEEPILEVDVCIGCRKCERECPTACIDMVDGPKLRKDKPIIIPEFDYNKCIGCQQCVDVCPVDCLHMMETEHDLEGFYNINFEGTFELLEEAVGRRP